jgi:transcription elongation factor Elf1
MAKRKVRVIAPINGGVLHWRFRCPFCGSVQISKYTRRKRGYCCDKCGAEFLQPIDLLKEVKGGD